MKLYFGLEFDEFVLPEHLALAEDSHCCGQRSLLHLLEVHTGSTRQPDDVAYLRVEQYRQALKSHLTDFPHAFFARSFAADQFATADHLLSRRDELLLSGWSFAPQPNMPQRLKTLATVEATLHHDGGTLTQGFADRFANVMRNLNERRHPFTEIWLNEPLGLLPVHLQRLFQKLSQTWDRPSLQPLWSTTPTITGHSDLAAFQRVVSSQTCEKESVKADGSLVLLRCRRASDAATFLAALFRKNPRFRPACILSEKDRLLETAMIREGLPSFGIPSSSLSRPALQLLKLAPTFLWDPPNPYKILEFVSLPFKPLHDDLANRIAWQIAATPGLHSDSWNRTIGQFFSAFGEREGLTSPAYHELRQQYRFWFERQRYDQHREAPKADAIELFKELHDWALREYEQHDEPLDSLHTLAEQARRVADMLETLPETTLTQLELERIVRTLHEPSPVVFQPRQTGHLPFAGHPAAVAGRLDSVLWWNFAQNEAPHFFPRWYGSERQFLAHEGITPDSPTVENDRQLWQQRRPVIAVGEQLLLVLPETINGQPAQPHPLMADLQATFNDIDLFTVDLDTRKGEALLGRMLELPLRVPINTAPPEGVKPFLYVSPQSNPAQTRETMTSLETLFYYPYIWFLRYQLKLVPSPILSVVPEATLMGNLAHRVFEELLHQDIVQMDKPQVEAWVDDQYQHLLQREGTTLLMYGQTPKRVAFGNKLKHAAWSLICHIRQNNWSVHATEMPLEGRFPPSDDDTGTMLRGIADVVLERGEELAVLDLKWSGYGRRKTMIQNNEDLQLVLYSLLLTGDTNRWPHTGYFILDQARLLSRNHQAFRQAIALKPEEDHREACQQALQAMVNTWHWRLGQLRHGQIEIRTTGTASEIEAVYNENGLDRMQLLEPKNEDAPFDDYRVLIGLSA